MRPFAILALLLAVGPAHATAIMVGVSSNGIVLVADSHQTPVGAAPKAPEAVDKIVTLNERVAIASSGYGTLVLKRNGVESFRYEFRPWLKAATKKLPRTATVDDYCDALVRAATATFGGRSDLTAVGGGVLNDLEFVVAGLQGDQPVVWRILVRQDTTTRLMSIKHDKVFPGRLSQAALLIGFSADLNTLGNEVIRRDRSLLPALTSKNPTVDDMARTSMAIIQLEAERNPTRVGGPFLQYIIPTSGAPHWNPLR